MQDYVIHRSTRRCRVSHRPLRPGETFYSVVEAKGASTVRYDIAAENWSGPPEHSIAWWRSVRPQTPLTGPTATPDETLRQRLAELCDDPTQAVLAYLLAMLLLRRRVLELLPEDETWGQTACEEAANGQPVRLRCGEDQSEYAVELPAMEIGAAEYQQYQQALQQLLVMEAAGDDGEAAEPEEGDDRAEAA